MKKYLALVLLLGLGMAFAPSCKKEKKHAPKKVHKTHVKKHKKGGVKVQMLVSPTSIEGPEEPTASSRCINPGAQKTKSSCIKANCAWGNPGAFEYEHGGYEPDSKPREEDDYCYDQLEASQMAY